MKSMKKESIIAILLGVGLGLIVAVLVTIKTRHKETQKVSPISNELHVTPTVMAKLIQTSTLEISEPQMGAISATNSIIIKGHAPKNTLIIIQSPLQTITLKNDTEDFSQKFPLALGENIIIVTAYPKDQQGVGTEKDLKVYYLDEQ